RAWCRSVDAAQAARRLGLASPASAALGHWVGVIRETFEEVGILLAYAPDGRPVRVDGGRYADYRRACQADHRAFWEMLRADRRRCPRAAERARRADHPPARDHRGRQAPGPVAGRARLLLIARAVSPSDPLG